MRLSIRWPAPPATIPETEFFCGAWHPHERLEVDVSVRAGAHRVRSLRGDNWWLAATELDLAGSSRSLVQSGEGSCDAFIFRGYLVDPCVQGWSEPSEVQRQLARGLPTLPNGVFALARVLDGGTRLELTTDTCGISPLYLRRQGGLVLFANSTRLLSTVGDAMDRLGGRALLGGALFGNHSLNEHVQRLEPGVQLTITDDGEKCSPRPGLGFLPAVSRRIDDSALDELEGYWRQSMERCLRIPADDRLLLLSSGWDSRRILSALLAEKAEFRAQTVKVIHKTGRELDARFASELSRRFDFRHEVVSLTQGDEFVAMDRDRRILFDSESQQHSWLVPLCERLESRGSLVFDGLAGDVLGETGVMDAEYLRASSEDARAQMAMRMASKPFDRILRPIGWPSSAELSIAIEDWIRTLPEAQGRELPFLLGHSRRTIAVATQWLMPAGFTAVYPFMDLDYLCFAGTLDPLDKLVKSTQVRCLERYAPELASISGSRAIPEGLQPESGSVRASQTSALIRARESELREFGLHGSFLDSLRMRPRVQVRLGVGVAAWWHASISELFLCDSLRVPAWDALPRA